MSAAFLSFGLLAKGETLVQFNRFYLFGSEAEMGELGKYGMAVEYHSSVLVVVP